jgi:hypothetical protein
MPGPSLLRDFEYLRQVQYRDSSRLADRAGLHAKYSTSTAAATTRRCAERARQARARGLASHGAGLTRGGQAFPLG